MSVTLRSFLASAVWLISSTPFGAGAEPLVVASASNFAPTARDIAARFEADTGQSVRVSSASTGKLYAQITQGAPFDVLLAADAERPRLLEDSGQAAAATRFTYAIGRLVLWSRDPAFSGADCREQLERLDHRRLAIANPDIAPYGEAARETLLKLGLWERVRPQLVVGENIGQTLQFVASGNASLGFIAATQSLDARLPETTCRWPVPPDLHRRIEQQAVLLSRAAENSAALDFMAFLRASAGRAIIERHGYALPDQVDAWRE